MKLSPYHFSGQHGEVVLDGEAVRAGERQSQPWARWQQCAWHSCGPRMNLCGSFCSCTDGMRGDEGSSGLISQVSKYLGDRARGPVSLQKTVAC